MEALTAELRLSVLRRRQWAEVECGAPAGLCLWKKTEPHLFPPSHVARGGGRTHRARLAALCREANLPPTEWDKKKYAVSLLDTDSFMSSAHSPSASVPLVRGLPLVARPDLEEIRRGARFSAAYLTRTQDPSGAFARLLNPTSQMRQSEDSAVVRARCASALARFFQRHKSQETRPALEACRRALRSLFTHIRSAPEGPRLAFVDGGEETTLTTATVLEGFCAYRQASSNRQYDELINALARFLRLLQDETGRIRSPHTFETTAEPTIEFDIETQVQVAIAFTSAYSLTDNPAYLLGARRSLALVRSRREEFTSHRLRHLYITAIERLARFLPVKEHLPAVRDMLENTMRVQLGEDAVRAPDLDGGIDTDFPPSVERTAAATHMFSLGWLLWKPGESQAERDFREKLLRCSRKGARYLLQFQFQPENSYYLPNPTRPLGGYRRRPGSNMVTLRSVLNGLDALGTLERVLTLKNREDDDTKSENR
jgi:hypothetical protein